MRGYGVDFRIMKKIPLFYPCLVVGLVLGSWIPTMAQSQSEVGPTKVNETNEVTPLTLPGAETFIFKKLGETELRLHLVKPNDWKASDRRPCLVSFFGGGWTSGTPAKSITYAKWAAKYGLVGVAPDYRTRKRFDTKPEDCVADGRAAVRWTQDHAKELGIDPGKIVVQGSSAGGHVAAWTAIPGPVSPELASDPVPSPAPMGLILLWPVTDTGTNGYGGPKRFGDDELRANNLSVTGRMPAKMPPTLVFHGTADATVKFANTEEFLAKMKANGNECELISFPGAPHSPNSSKWGEATAVKAKIEQESLKFLEKLGLVSSEQASVGGKTTDKKDGE
jgi:acetyl esterase/lipase